MTTPPTVKKERYIEESGDSSGNRTRGLRRDRPMFLPSKLWNRKQREPASCSLCTPLSDRHLIAGKRLGSVLITKPPRTVVNMM